MVKRYFLVYRIFVNIRAIKPVSTAWQRCLFYAQQFVYFYISKICQRRRVNSNPLTQNWFLVKGTDIRNTPSDVTRYLPVT